MNLSDQLKANIRNIPDYPKVGIQFKDITPVLGNPALVRDIIQEQVRHFKSLQIEAIAGIEARGFILGSILAHELHCPFIPIRKTGKLPYKTKSQSYALEYGMASVEIHVDAIEQGMRVLIHDDLLATGGTATAAGQLVKDLGGTLAGFSFLVNLSFLPGAKQLIQTFGLDPHSITQY